MSSVTFHARSLEAELSREAVQIGWGLMGSLPLHALIP